MPVYLLTDDLIFPSPDLASDDGLLAVGGDLSQKRLLVAYSMGIFPWYSKSEPILWWSPNPRLVLYPDELRVSKSLQKTIRKDVFQLTLDQAFEQVIVQCAKTRRQKNEGTWIVDDMITAYCKLHESGFAHSVEAWQDQRLVGGLYGVSLGKCFFGESMFTLITNASKVAFVALVEYLRSHFFDIVDCQVSTEHLMSFGAREIPRNQYLKQLKRSLTLPTQRGKWSFDNST
jgi:leucyl/phenylalanyl-tRNA--protein transferase